MIFVTIGTQEPFDRLIKVMDEIAQEWPDERIVAQTIGSQYEAKHIETVGFISPKEFEQLIDESSLIVGHAGMGTIISALTKNKPLLIMPRLYSLGEHRNDHQMATAKKMEELGYVHVVYEPGEIKEKIYEILKKNEIDNLNIGSWASRKLTDSLKEFILSGSRSQH